jgi:hypothetical protein
VEGSESGLIRGSQETHEIPQSGYPTSGPKFEPGTSEVQRQDSIIQQNVLYN